MTKYLLVASAAVLLTACGKSKLTDKNELLAECIGKSMFLEDMFKNIPLGSAPSIPDLSQTFSNLNKTQMEFAASRFIESDSDQKKLMAKRTAEYSDSVKNEFIGKVKELEKKSIDESTFKKHLMTLNASVAEKCKAAY